MLKYLYESQYYKVFTELRGFLEYIELNLTLNTQNPQKYNCIIVWRDKE